MTTVNREPATVTKEQVRDYYGKVLQNQKDLKTSACCSADAIPLAHRRILALLEDEILDRFYGCGSPIPPLLEGCTVLDLGCGSGRDAYLVSKLVGESGRVIGIDMTDEQLAVARRHAESQAERFGFAESNVDFRQGYIEDLAEAGIEDNSVDAVISNCVINLSPDKPSVFREIFRVLRPGGELFFADVFADRRIPDHVREDPVIYGECLGGALYVEDFRRILAACGCADARVTACSPIELTDPEVDRVAGMIPFTSRTIRAFKLAALEDCCEDYGQVAVYRGTIWDAPHAFDLDLSHRFETGRPQPVCGNTAAMLEETRYADHFDIIGSRDVHYGLFDCEPPETEFSSPCC